MLSWKEISNKINSFRIMEFSSVLFYFFFVSVCHFTHTSVINLTDEMEEII